MGNRIFYWFVLLYALIVFYDSFYGYLFKSKDEVIGEAIVARLDKNKNPILQFKLYDQVFTYKDKYANRYLFVKVGEPVTIKYKTNLNQNYITNIEIIDFKYQLFAIDKIIFHVILLLISFLAIHKHKYK